MALKANRVGVRKDQVDIYGRPISPSFFESLVNDLPAWTDLPVWKSGTEQLLPVNDDEPDTSPILCDIEYPVADLKNNQYFTYRQSPTQKDGLAKIRGIKGKTLVCNQQIPIRTTSDTVAGVTVTSNKDGSYSINGTASSTNANYWFDTGSAYAGKYTSVTGHKLFIKDVLIVQSSGLVGKQEASFGESKIITSNFDGATRFRMPAFVNGNEYSNVKVVPMCIDLTLMFGAGKEPTTVDEFKALFPLPYYKYNIGSLLDFTGTKVKTSNKNLLPTQTVSNTTEVTVTADKGVYTLNGTTTAYRQIIATSVVYLNAGTYTLSRNASAENNRVSVQLRSTDGNTKYADVKGTPATFTLSSYTAVKFRITIDNGASLTNYIIRPQLEFGSSATEFEPYITQETELPTSTFFPTGMKSAGVVYDELTPTRAITRVGQVDLGSLTWTATTNNRYISTGIASVIKAPVNNQTVANILCEKYLAVTYSDIVDNSALGIAINGSSANKGNICIRDTGTYADAAAFKTAMSGVMLNYELAVEDVQPTMSFDSE